MRANPDSAQNNARIAKATSPLDTLTVILFIVAVGALLLITIIGLQSGMSAAFAATPDDAAFAEAKAELRQQEGSATVQDAGQNAEQTTNSPVQQGSQSSEAVEQAGSSAAVVDNRDPAEKESMEQQAIGEPQLEEITFGGGCFWCTEAVFQQLRGVTAVESGYCNGEVENPTYEQVCSGRSGHAEVIRIQYDPAQVEFATLLEVFFKTHDPTTLNRQGADTGTQYRSGVFYHTDQQRDLASLFINRLNELQAYPSPIVTEVTAIDNYSRAEDYHQNYYQSNQNQGYCRAVIQPKMEKFREAFADQLKPAMAGDGR